MTIDQLENPSGKSLTNEVAEVQRQTGVIVT